MPKVQLATGLPRAHDVHPQNQQMGWHPVQALRQAVKGQQVALPVRHPLESVCNPQRTGICMREEKEGKSRFTKPEPREWEEFTYAPFMAALFDSRPLTLMQGAPVLVAGVLLFAVLEVEKRILRRRRAAAG